ncbi:MAG: ATP synthase F0 subunit C [Elusimicrobiota bacterium]
MVNEMLYLGLGYLAAGFGAGLCVFGAASSISRVAAAALEGTARQPEAAGDLRTSMLLPSAFIEGLGLFGIVVCLLVAMNFGLKPTPNAGHSAAAATQAAH